MKGRQRRFLAITCTLMCVAATASIVQAIRDRLGDESTFTGWTLLASTAGLYLLSARKKWIQARLGPVAAWMQMHVYMGVFASVVFLMHIGWPIRGVFEMSLASCFAIVAVTGIVLGVMSRTTPVKLAALPTDYRLERIPAIQSTVAHSAHITAISSSELGEGATLSEYYQRKLLPFFQTPRSFWYRILPNGLTRRRLLRELDDLDRYLAKEGIASRQNLTSMVKSKDDLDYQYALQTRLRMLFALHISLTWALVLMIGVHVVLVYRFQGAL